jgi:hypothetical protein
MSSVQDRAGAVAAAGMLVAAVLAVTPLPAAAQQPTVKEGGAIFTCTSAAGRRLTADRPIAECLDREQRVLNRDGSLRMVMQPSLTADERAALEEAERKKAQDRIAKQDAIRRDRNLLARYPNEAAHERARQAALESVRESILASQKRVAELEKERKPLVSETEFYAGKPLPAKLRNQIGEVDASLQAQQQLLVTQQAEVGRINALFDAELVRLRKLWGGAEPGSLGPLPQSALAASAESGKPLR